MKIAELSWIELSRAALEQNVAALATIAPGKMMAVSVKANAYGHGLAEMVALLADNKKVHYLSVHSIEEAEVCRWAGWERAILLLGPMPADEAEAVLELDLEPVVFDRATLERLGRLGDRAGRSIKTHLKLETGTNRQGIGERELTSFAAVYKKHQSLRRPYGASTHFANIEDTIDHEYADYQLAQFRALTGTMKKLGIGPTIRHTASSAAALLFDQTHFDLIRPGISVYGHWPSRETYLSYRLGGGKNNILRPVLSWKARVTQIKKLAADEYIGYGCTYRTTSPARLAILPVGYYDGYDRLLSNQSHVLINGRRAPVRGRICMNLMMIDITDSSRVRLGSPATLIGVDGDQRVSVEQLAEWAQTISYEVLARLSPSLPRLITA